MVYSAETPWTPSVGAGGIHRATRPRGEPFSFVLAPHAGSDQRSSPGSGVTQQDDCLSNQLKFGTNVRRLCPDECEPVHRKAGNRAPLGD